MTNATPAPDQTPPAGKLRRDCRQMYHEIRVLAHSIQKRVWQLADARDLDRLTHLRSQLEEAVRDAEDGP